MVNFYTQNSTNSFSLYPETGSNDSTFRLRLTQDLDLSQTEFYAKRLNSPSPITDLVVLQVTSSQDLPQYTGQYTLELYTVGTLTPTLWSQATTTFGANTDTWSNQYTGSLGTLLDTDRAYVFGADQPNFTQYTTTNENGSYTTYHG